MKKCDDGNFFYDPTEGSDEEEDMIHQHYNDFFESPPPYEPPPQLLPLIDANNISISSEASDFVSFSVMDDEYELYKEGNQAETDIQTPIEPVEAIIVNVAHLQQFPKPSSSFSASLPCVFAWFDANTTFHSEFPSAIRNIFKIAYNNLKSPLRIYYNIGADASKLEKTSLIRLNEVQAGGILFHYIGYGYPTITSENIWCGDRRSDHFDPFPLKKLFKSIPPPAWYIFDCSNAGAVIPSLIQIQEELIKESPMEEYWSDWFCICASKEGESLPDDPRLPRDFLTAAVLSPIKLAVICHILQHYRLTLVSENFPITSPCSELWNENQPDSEYLLQTLSAITEAIAADSLTDKTYNLTFRNERFSSLIFRNFLLAQYLLRPYRVHPVSHPALPDLSRHYLWRQWSVILDTAICSVASKPAFASDLYLRNATSFSVFLDNGQLDLIRPYHFTLLYHYLLHDRETDFHIQLLSKYAALPQSSPSYLTKSVYFNVLFKKLISLDPHSQFFHSTCYLVAKLLCINTKFASDIRIEGEDVSKFPLLMFDTTLPEETRLLISAIVSSVVVPNEKFQETCTSAGFWEHLNDSLKTCGSECALWLLIVIRRSFIMYSPDPKTYTHQGAHLQVALFVNHPSPIVRASAISVLMSFLRIFEFDINNQLIYLVLPSLADASYIVRFQLVLFIKKFLMYHDDYGDSKNDINIPFCRHSFVSFLNEIYRCQNKPLKYFNNIYKIAERCDILCQDENSKSLSCSASMSLLEFLVNDPHPSVRAIALKFSTFLKHKKQNTENESQSDDSSAKGSFNEFTYFNMSYAEDGYEDEQIELASLDQNDSLYMIALRNLIDKRIWKINDGKPNDLPTNVTSFVPDATPTEIKRSGSKEQSIFMKVISMITGKDDDAFEITPIINIEAFQNQPISCLVFDEATPSIAVASNNVIRYYRQYELINELECENKIVRIQFITSQSIIFSTNDNVIHIWDTAGKHERVIFRTTPEDIQEGISHFAISKVNIDELLTISSNNVISLWDIKLESLINEWEFGKGTVTTVAAHPTKARVYYFGLSNGTLVEINLEENELKINEVSLQINRQIISISQSYKDTMFVVTDSCWCETFSLKESIATIKPIQMQQKGSLVAFTAFGNLPFVVFSTQSSVPYLTDLNGRILNNFKGLVASPACGAHITLNLLAFGTQAGELFIYKLCPNHK